MAKLLNNNQRLTDQQTNQSNACELIEKAEKELEAKDEQLKDIDTKTPTESVSAT
jgi:hypothetical protein